MTTATGDPANSALAANHAEPVAGLDGSAASTRTRAARVDTYCAYCGRRMSPGRHGRRRYCSNSCRTGAYKKRRRAAASTVGQR